MRTATVVGAGVFGSWTAWALERRGWRVSLVEAHGPANSRASSGGETRISRSGYGGLGIYARWARESLGDWLDLELRSGETLSQLTSIGPWSPTVKEHWVEHYVNLSAFAGEPEVRLAFIVKNRNGNNLYIDNIQFYSSLQPTPSTIQGEFAVYPNPTIPGQEINMTFNLPDLAEQVQVEVIDARGKIVASREYKDILNQSYEIDLANYSSGLYIFRVTTPTQVYFSKLVYQR